MTKTRYTNAVSELENIAEDIYKQMKKGQIPSMKIPVRTKTNIKFSRKNHVWTLGKSMGARSAKKLDGAYMLLRTLHMMEFIEAMINDQKSSTLREMYYISEGWEQAKFSTQNDMGILLPSTINLK